MGNVRGMFFLLREGKGKGGWEGGDVVTSPRLAFSSYVRLSQSTPYSSKPERVVGSVVIRERWLLVRID